MPTTTANKAAPKKKVSRDQIFVRDAHSGEYYFGQPSDELVVAVANSESGHVAASVSNEDGLWYPCDNQDGPYPGGTKLVWVTDGVATSVKEGD